MRSEAANELTLSIDTHAQTPIPVQLSTQIRDAIAKGQLAPGDAIPSTRTLATQLGVARGTIVATYEQLAAEGYLISERGSGTRINPELRPLSARNVSKPRRKTSISLSNLTPGIPDTNNLIDPTWRAAWRAASRTMPSLPTEGAWELREEISHHLRHMRGLVVEPEHIIVTSGARDGLMVLLLAMGAGLRIGVESPGYPSLRRVPKLLGHQLINTPTDQHGITPEALQPMDALIVTPSHQYPHGGSLPAKRRTQLANWAGQGHWLIEDDYDSELRYQGQPLPPLAALAPKHTALLGTFSTLISPSIACGYLIAPPGLHAASTQIREQIGQPTSANTQLALANYMANGGLRRRTQRLRRTYTRRRDIVANTLHGIPGTTLRPIHGGLHAVILCERPAREVVQNCAAQGLNVTALDQYWGGAASTDNGIVIGFGALEDAQLQAALNILAGALGG